MNSVVDFNYTLLILMPSVSSLHCFKCVGSEITFGWLLFSQTGRSRGFSFVYFEDVEDAIDVGSVVVCVLSLSMFVFFRPKSIATVLK